jgi:hypothetical protein
MHLTLMLPGSLVPADIATELIAALRAPALARLLERAAPAETSTSKQDSAESTWIARHVFGTPGRAPTAPYAWTALSGVADTAGVVWHAEPVHIEVGRDSLIVRGLDDAPPDEAEADALVAAANETLAQAHCELRRAGSQWFLHTDRAWSFMPPAFSDALDQAYSPAESDEPDSMHWSRLHNAIQMRWHMDPVNEAREGRGLPPINALWLHGGGSWQALRPLRWPRVHSERAELHGAATAAGSTSARVADAVSGDALLVWDDALRAARAYDWSAWLESMSVIDRRLATLPSFQTLELVLAGGRRARSWIAQPSDRLKFWRSTSLAEAMTEAKAEAPSA